MRKRRHVLESATENARRNPARIFRDPPRLREGTVQKIGVKSQRAAVAWNIRIVDVQAEQIGVGKKRHVYAIGYKISLSDLADHFVVKKEVEQRAQHQHKRASVSGSSR